MNTLYKLETTPLSFNQIQHFFIKAVNKKVKIVQLDSIKPTDKIEDILGPDKMIILYISVQSLYNGHYTSIFLQGNGLYFFDSYGNGIKKLLNIINSEGQVRDPLTLFNIMQNSGYQLFHNGFDYQSMTNSQIADCGRYSSLNLIMFSEARSQGKSYSFNDFFAYLTDFKNKNNLPDYDSAVTLATTQL